MADHVFSRIDIPGWLARTGFQMLDPIKTAQSRLDFLRQLHDREALLPREQQRRFLASEGWIAWSGPGDLRTAQAVHRAQPDDDRRLRHPRRAGHARPTSTARCWRSSARSTTSASRRRCAASSAPPRRPTSTNTSSAQGISAWSSDRRRPRRRGRPSPQWVQVDRRRRRACPRASTPMALQPAEHTESGVALASRRGARRRRGRRDGVQPGAVGRRRRRRRQQVGARAGRRDGPHPAEAGPPRSDQRPHPDLARPHHVRAGARRARTASACCSTGACTPTRRWTAASTTWSAASSRSACGRARTSAC